MGLVEISPHCYHPRIMNITINGKTQDLPEEVKTVEALLVHLEMAGKPAAVECNKTLIPKRQHAETALSDGDQVEIVTLVGGG